MNKTFAEVVKDSHHCCCERYSLDWPTDTMIAEDILDNYELDDTPDVSNPYKYNEWVEKVRLELNRQGLTYVVN